MKQSEIKRIKGDTNYEKERKRKIEKSKLICDHKYEEGRRVDAAVVSTKPDSTELECEICHRRMNVAPIPHQKQIEAIETVKNMYDCIKLSMNLSQKQREDISNAILLIEGLPVAYKEKFINRRREPDYVEERVSNNPLYLDKLNSRRSYNNNSRRRRDDDYEYEEYDDRRDRRKKKSYSWE